MCLNPKLSSQGSWLMLCELAVRIARTTAACEAEILLRKQNTRVSKITATHALNWNLFIVCTSFIQLLFVVKSWDILVAEDESQPITYTFEHCRELGTVCELEPWAIAQLCEYYNYCVFLHVTFVGCSHFNVCMRYQWFCWTVILTV